MSRMHPIQAKLDIVERSRTSLLPWRGQFSPELIEHLIETFCPKAQKLADPFCGSGTVLAEAMRTGRPAVGIDINPAAYVLSSFSHLLALSPSERAQLAAQATKFISPHVEVDGDLFRAEQIVPTSIASVVAAAEEPRLRLLLHVGALIGCGDSTDLSLWKLAKGVQSVLRTLAKFEAPRSRVEVLLGDARHELSAHRCDAIITSPPYINVFNYHQNYRPIMEHLGWTPLACAIAEIGANRKHRQNRFLTVTQYCMDMALLFRAGRAALEGDGTFVIVLGRESNVLRTAFYNGDLIDEVVEATGYLSVASRHERVFKNRFGASIYEDILVLRPNSKVGLAEAKCLEAAREIGVASLQEALSRAPEDARPLIEQAIEGGNGVKPCAHPKVAKSPLWPAF